MAYGYRKRISLGKGNYINIGKNGVSFSAGVPGCRITTSSKGTYLTTGIPGTGIYSRQKIEEGNYLNWNSQNTSNGMDNNKLSEGMIWLFILIWLIFSVGYTYFWGNDITSDFPLALCIVSITSAIPLFIVYYIFVEVFRLLYKRLYLYSKEKQRISEELDMEEFKCVYRMNEQIDNASKNIQTNSEPLWKKVQQNFIDNHARSILEDHYLNVRKTLSERQDFDNEYVRANYEANEEKISTLIEDRPYIDLDIISEFAQPIIDAYLKFSIAWFKMTFSDITMINNNIIAPFPSFTFGRVSIGEIPIPSCINENGDIVYFFPTFVAVLNNDFSIAFYPLDKIGIIISERIVTCGEYQYPKDSAIVRESWEHSNKDGSRDARFSDNQRYRHCKFASIMIIGLSKLFSFEVSNYEYSSLINVNFLDLKNLVLKPLKTGTEENLARLKKKTLDQLDVKVSISKYSEDAKQDDNKQEDAKQEDKLNPWGFTAFDLDSVDPLFIDVVNHILIQNEILISPIKRKFNIDYNRVQQILHQIEDAGIITLADFVQLKKINFTKQQFKDWISFQEACKQANDSQPKKDEEKKDKIRGSKHYVGEKHPIKPWIWTEYSPGKFDWRRDKRCKQTNTGNSLEDKKQDANAINELNSLIGLNDVKEEIAKLQNFIKIQMVRKEHGLKLSPISYHCVFTGNPGTGKTTVARIVAEIYKDLGILKKGHLIETDRSGLVAEYIGQTAVKTNKVIDSALDGVLFIDEAYSLAPASPNDFGNEAIATLLKRMEDERDRLIVILAGYGNEMQTFIDSNPGFQSRFNRYIHFNDYSADDLMSIFELNLKKNQYIISESARELMGVYFGNVVANKDKNFGNGRFVRNIFEQIVQSQSSRLSKISNLSKKDLQLIIDEDIPQS